MKVNLTLGPTAFPIRTQLRDQGIRIPNEFAREFREIQYALNSLWLTRLTTHKQQTQLERRFTNRVKRVLVNLGKFPQEKKRRKHALYKK